MVRGHAVKEQHPVEVVDLVLKRPGLEGVGLYHPIATVDVDPANDEPCGARNVTGEVGHAHATLAGHVGTVCEEDLGVEEHDLSVARHRLLMAGDVHDEDPFAHANLRRGKADTGRRRPHRVDEIDSERPRVSIDAADR